MARMTTLLCLGISVAVIHAQEMPPENIADTMISLIEDSIKLNTSFGNLINRKRAQTDEWLRKMYKEADEVNVAKMKAWWKQTTDLDDRNAQELHENASIADVKFWGKFMAEARKINCVTRSYLRDEPQRHLYLIKKREISALNESITERKIKISSLLRSIYGKAKVCRGNEAKGANCLSYVPDIASIIEKSNDVSELKWAWQGWRNATGVKMRSLYTEFVSLQNEAARDSGFADTGDYWRQNNFGPDDMTGQAENMYNELMPLYKQLFTYVRGKLFEKYGHESGIESEDGIQTDGPIPAHLLGNMWGQSWHNLLPILHPYPDVAPNDITKEMKRQNYTVEKMVKMSEKFFTSLGLLPMNEGFWKNSIFEKPTDKKTGCTALAADFGDSEDFRIKMCAVVDHQNLNVIHHEMGHIEYFMYYKDLPLVYRGGANSAFHEAIGDLIALSVTTDTHLEKVGLLDKQAGVMDKDMQDKRDINALMEKALRIVAFLPFGYMIDKWRWDVFNGKIASENYNREWWYRRLKYQGLVPPMTRTEKDFDPGSKFHVAWNVPYFRYFISYIIQIQFYEAMCAHTNHTGPLHRCDFYQSKEAGEKLKSMMKLGASKPWPEAMKVLTGQKEMSAKPFTRYFAPLYEWLDKQNEKKPVGWLRPWETVETVIAKYFD